jgi:N-glycosylase/DNA lyase
MNELLDALRTLKDSDVSTLVNQRIREFKHVNTHSSLDLFKELCFCILTANFSAHRAIDIHATLAPCFSTASPETLSKKLRACGYRFPTTRATYIVEATQQTKKLPSILRTLTGNDLRDWLVDHISGLGYKEASHFLRNIGYDDYAIIDSHIIDLLERYHLHARPKSLTKKKYLEIEDLLRSIASHAGLTVAELDLYLWYMETGMVLK